MLVEWGTAIADEMRVPAYIEGTSIARSLYEKCGFRVLGNEWVVVHVGEKWRRERPEIRSFFYERPAKGGKVEGEGVVEGR